MDQSQNGPNGHVQQQQQQQLNNHGSAYNTFLDGPSSFTDDTFGVSEDHGNGAGYDFAWSAELFQDSAQVAPTFSHHSPSPVPNFDHHAQQQHSSTPGYGGIQSTLSPSPFNQSQAYDNRSATHQSYEPRPISRVLPSPSYSYQPVAYQHNPNYPPRDQMLSPSQFQRPVSNASMMLGAQQQQRPSPTLNPSYVAPPSQSPYQSMDPRQMHQPGYQGSDMGHFAAFNEQSQQPANQFVSPQMLTASGMRGGAGYAHQTHGQQPGRQTPDNMSPYMNALFNGDMRMYQSAHAFQQSIAPAYNMQNVQTTGMNVGPSTSTFQGVIMPPKTIKPKAPKDPNAPQKARSRPQKDGMVPKVKKDGEASSSEESESEDELQVEEPEPEITPAPLTLAPPTELKARAVYDAVAAVWSPRNLPAKTEKVKAGGQLYSDTIRKLRDAWKPENEALTAAENANNVPKATILREKVEGYRETLKKILDRTDQYGHPAHLRHIPLYPYTLSAFNSFLVDRIKRDDYEAPLVTSMMKAFTRFDTMTEEQLEQSKLIKLVQRVSKKGNAETKALAQKVLDNATAATKTNHLKAQPDAASASPKVANGSSVLPAKSVSQSGLPTKTDAVAGVKRSREGDGNLLPATKKPLSKPIVQASKPLAVQQAERRKAELAKQQNAAKNGKPLVNGTPAVPAPKPKVISAPAKPAPGGAFAGLMSASKKPGTTMAEKAAAAKAKPLVSSSTIRKQESSPQPSSAATRPTFSFLDALQGMDKPKEVEKKKEEVRPNETEEERKKRLRKEERGKLRVSWADKLTDVRLFIHDPEEERGHDDSMMRDVDDVAGEGRMLKMHLDEDDLEDEEGEELDSYDSPSEVDFSDIDWEERKSHFVKTGGPEMPESSTSEAQRLHEDSSVMVVYALPSDQPSSPKEPPDSEDDYEPDLPSSFGEPPDQVREKEKRWLAARPQERHAQAPNGTFDINAMLRNVQQPQATQQVQIPPELQRTLALLGQQQSQPLPQPPPQPHAAPIADLSNIMAVVNQMKGMHQQHPQSMHQPQAAPPPIFPQPTPTIQPNVAAIMAALQNAQKAQSQPQPALPVGSHSNPNPNLYPSSTPDADFSRKHARADSGADDSDISGGKKSNKKKKGSGAGGSGPIVASAGGASTMPGASGDVPYNYKTMVCSFWQKGMCTKGENCTYRHEE